jgi:hypothetical protein
MVIILLFSFQGKEKEEKLTFLAKKHIIKKNQIKKKDKNEGKKYNNK